VLGRWHAATRAFGVLRPPDEAPLA